MIVAPYPCYDTKDTEDIVVHVSQYTPREGRIAPESELRPCVFMFGKAILTNPEHKDFVVASLLAGNIKFRVVDHSPTSETHEAEHLQTACPEKA
jgi:hypothetical protein